VGTFICVPVLHAARAKALDGLIPHYLLNMSLSHWVVLVQKRVAMVMKKAGIKGQIMLIAFLVVLFIILFVLVFLT